MRRLPTRDDGAADRERQEHLRAAATYALLVALLLTGGCSSGKQTKRERAIERQATSGPMTAAPVPADGLPLPCAVDAGTGPQPTPLTRSSPASPLTVTYPARAGSISRRSSSRAWTARVRACFPPRQLAATKQRLQRQQVVVGLATEPAASVRREVAGLDHDEA